MEYKKDIVGLNVINFLSFQINAVTDNNIKTFFFKSGAWSSVHHDLNSPGR